MRITDIDLTPYQATPMLSAEGTLTLANDLYNGRPADSPQHVLISATRMYTCAGALKQGLIEKVEDAGVALGTEVAFDSVTDRLWSASRRRCEYWMIYASDGFDLLSDDEQDKLDLDDKREKAELARELDKHLFGEDGLNFLKRPFSQQVALMASRLSFIAASDKVAAYEEVLGTELLEALNIVQGRYEAMVHTRSMRNDNSANLRVLRHDLQRYIQLYASAVITMLDPDDPESVDVVLSALRPMINARTGRRSGSGSATDEAEQDTELEAGTDEHDDPVDVDVETETD